METTKIYAALAKFAALCPAIAKDSENPHFRSKYASLSAIQTAIKEPLAKAGLVLSHAALIDNVTSTVYCVEDGSSLSSTFPFTLGKPQENGSAITYAKRYNTAALLNLDTDADDDGNEANEAKPAKAAKSAPAASSATEWLNRYKFKGSKDPSADWLAVKARVYAGEFPTAADLLADAAKAWRLSGEIRGQLEQLFSEYANDPQDLGGLELNAK